MGIGSVAVWLTYTAVDLIPAFIRIPCVNDFIVRAVALKTLMTGTHSPFSFLIDCHFFVLAIFPADLNDFLIMWQEFVRELSEFNEIEQNVILRDLCHEFMCVCALYTA